MKHEIDMLDDEYTTPAQAEEIRRMKAELPLWQEMELAKDATINVEPHAIDCFSTEAPKVDADTVETTGGVLSGDYGDGLTKGDGTGTWAQWLVDLELHRALNGTQGQESEQ